MLQNISPIIATRPARYWTSRPVNWKLIRKWYGYTKQGVNVIKQQHETILQSIPFHDSYVVVVVVVVCGGQVY